MFKKRQKKKKLSLARSLILRDCGRLAAVWMAVAVALLVFLPAGLPAQDGDDQDLIRIKTELVPFEVTVTDAAGKPVRGLTAGDFRIFEEGIERNVDFFEPVRKQNPGRPLSIVFALDVSGSMTGGELEKLRQALRRFVRRLADYNSHFAVTTFGMRVKKLQSFTNQPKKLEKTFSKIARDRDGLSTHAYDAVDYSIRLLKKKTPVRTVRQKIPKKAVILITDGFPVGDLVSPETVIERANLAETSVYAVILPSYSRLQSEKKPVMTLLEASGLIERTGGRTFYATGGNFEPLFKVLAEELTASYVLAFYPNRAPGDKKFRRVRIEVPKGLRVRQNRPGYRVVD